MLPNTIQGECDYITPCLLMSEGRREHLPRLSAWRALARTGLNQTYSENAEDDRLSWRRRSEPGHGGDGWGSLTGRSAICGSKTGAP